MPRRAARGSNPLRDISRAKTPRVTPLPDAALFAQPACFVPKRPEWAAAMVRRSRRRIVSVTSHWEIVSDPA